MEFTTLTTGLSFGEGPRWHDGYLYYSDFYRHVVERIDADGVVERVAEVPNQPSGLGWLPDGRLIVVSMTDRKLLRQEQDGTLVQHADLGDIARFHCNDMVVDVHGRAYVGNFGYDRTKESLQTAILAMVDIGGQVQPVADDLAFPNGMVITPDGTTLIVAETMTSKLTAFDIEPDGLLTNRRLWADIDPHYPDGICLDAEGAIWVADPVGNAVVRVARNGSITDKIESPRSVFACMLGGADGKRLFVCTGKSSGAKAAETRDACIEFVDVSVARAGLP